MYYSSNVFHFFEGRGHISYLKLYFIDTVFTVPACSSGAVWTPQPLLSELHSVLRSQGPKDLIFSLYSHILYAKLHKLPLAVCTKWRSLIPNLSDEDWEESCSSNLTVSPAVNNNLIQLNIFHQAYLMQI